jgi:hypothetical protein
LFLESRLSRRISPYEYSLADKKKRTGRVFVQGCYSRKARLSKSDVLWEEAVRIEECSGPPAQGKALLAPQECPTSGILWSMAIWSEARL